MSFDAGTYNWAACAPELLVSDLEKSLGFYRDILGFNVQYGRGTFVYLDYQGAQIMLDQRNGNWETGPMTVPFGRGINLQIRTNNLDTLLDALKQNGLALYLDDHAAWYLAGDKETGLRQFLVQDPDGYLLRFAQHLGVRPIA